METVVQETLRRQLVDRRERLQEALSNRQTDDDLVRLLGQVDAALSRIETSDYGRCLICSEDVDDEDLVANPLLEYCLCGLTPQQQRALEHDLGLARRLQAGLLPNPDLDASGWEAHYHYEPSGIVSGDYCDLRVPPDDSGTVFFAVADVSGKGVAASLLMAHLQAAFRSLLRPGLPLPELVERVNRQLLEANIPTHYATLACGRASADGRVEIVNAGHCPPLVVRGNGVETLGPTGFPVGLLGDRPYEMTEVRLDEGDGLVLYTDGLTEARASDDDEYGTDRLEKLLARGGGGDPRRVVQVIRADVEAFLGEEGLLDDLTVMVLRRS